MEWVGQPRGEGRLARTGMKQRALFLVTEDWYFASHRLALGRALRERGWRVGVACRRSSVAEALEAEGIEVLPVG